jgi:hypothetical protein
MVIVMIFILLSKVSLVATDLPLEPNETYTVSRTVTLPSYVAGSGYLLFKTDAYNYQTRIKRKR